MAVQHPTCSSQKCSSIIRENEASTASSTSSLCWAVVKKYEHLTTFVLAECRERPCRLSSNSPSVLSAHSTLGLPAWSFWNGPQVLQ